MDSRDFLVLIAIALVPLAMARQNPSDKEASPMDLTQKEGLYEPLGLLPLPPIILPPKPDHTCVKQLATSDEGTGVYEPSGLPKKGFCPPPPAPVPSPAPTPAPTPTSLEPTPSSPVPAPALTA